MRGCMGGWVWGGVGELTATIVLLLYSAAPLPRLSPAVAPSWVMILANVLIVIHMVSPRGGWLCSSACVQQAGKMTAAARVRPHTANPPLSYLVHVTCECR